MCGWVEVLGGQWPKVLQGSLSHWGPPINMSRQAGAFSVQKRSITITTQWAPNERSHGGGGGCFWAKNGITEHRSRKHCTTVDLCEKNVSQPTVCVCHIIWQQERQEREAGAGGRYRGVRQEGGRRWNTDMYQVSSLQKGTCIHLVFPPWDFDGKRN